MNCEIPHYVILSIYFVYPMFKNNISQWFFLEHPQSVSLFSEMSRPTPLKTEKNVDLPLFSAKEEDQKTVRWTVASSSEKDKSFGTFLSLFTSTSSNITPASLCFLYNFYLRPDQHFWNHQSQLNLLHHFPTPVRRRENLSYQPCENNAQSFDEPN